MGKHFGKCALCGKECDLTFEHIPPRKAFNDTPAKPVSGETLLESKKEDQMPWDLSGLKYDNQQKGMGYYSLCAECNNNTGSWYGDAYSEFAHIVFRAFTKPIPTDANCIELKEISPLRIIKQVISMFCSINSFDNSNWDDLRQFVLNKEDVGIDKTKYRIHMYFTKSSIMKYAPFSILLVKGVGEIDSIKLSEITAAPFGFILYFDPTDNIPYHGIDITGFADFKYNEIADIRFPLVIYEMNDLLPTHYRTKEEIFKITEENKKWKKKHESEDNI